MPCWRKTRKQNMINPEHEDGSLGDIAKSFLPLFKRANWVKDLNFTLDDEVLINTTALGQQRLREIGEITHVLCPSVFGKPKTTVEQVNAATLRFNEIALELGLDTDQKTLSRLMSFAAVYIEKRPHEDPPGSPGTRPPSL